MWSHQNRVDSYHQPIHTFNRARHFQKPKPEIFNPGGTRAEIRGGQNYDRIYKHEGTKNQLGCRD